MSAEIWKPIETHPEYEISDQGRIRRDGRILKTWGNGNGYAQVGLSSHSVVTRFFVHRLVAATFCGDPPTPNMDVAHWNGDSSDNRACNLRWASRAENMQDMRRHGRTTSGERNGQAKLTEQDVRAIHALRNSRVTYREIASKFGVRWQTVQDACNGRNWAHLGGCEPIPRGGLRSPIASQLP